MFFVDLLSWYERLIVTDQTPRRPTNIKKKRELGTLALCCMAMTEGDTTTTEQHPSHHRSSPVSVMEESNSMHRGSGDSLRNRTSGHHGGSNHGTKRSSADRNMENQLIDMIGKGPVRRYGPVCQAPPIQKRLERLNVEHLDAYVKIKTAYDEYLQGRKKPAQPLPEDLVLRAAVIHNFDDTKAVELLRRMEARYWTVTAKQLEKDLKLQMCVPVPHLKTKVCQDVIYFVPSQFEAKERSSSVVVSLMTYVMNCTYERYRDRRRKLCLMINLADWNFDQHFRLDCWLQLMDLWQGRSAPLRVSQVLMVNATEDFDKAWTTIKTMCNPNFVQRVHFLENQEGLAEYLSFSDYKDILPAELGGAVPTAHFVRDFLAYRVSLERLRKLNQSVNQSKFVPPTPTRTPLPVPETPKTGGSKHTKNLFQSSILDLPTPGLLTPSKPQRTVTEGVTPKAPTVPDKPPDTPAVSRRSLMSRNSSMPMLHRNNSSREKKAAIVEVDSDSDSDDDEPPRSSRHSKKHAAPEFDDPAVTAVQFQPAALAAVAADTAPSFRNNTDKDDKGSDNGSDHDAAASADKEEAPPEAPVPAQEGNKAPSKRRNRNMHRTSSVPRLMGGLGLSRGKSRHSKNLMTDDAPEDDGKVEDKKDEEKSKPRSGLLKNMGRKALNRFASMRNVSSSKSNTGKEGTGDHTSPTNSHTSGLDFDYDKDGDADAHLSCHGSKHGKGFQMLG